MTLSRRRTVQGLAAAVGALALPPLFAQAAYPSRPIRIVVPFAAGGPTDVLARALAERMSAAWRQPVIVDNKVGAGGNIAAAEVAKADADGYTLFAGIDSTVTINPTLYPVLPFAPEALSTVAILASSGLLVAAHPSLGVRTVQDLAAKARTQSLAFSSAGNGSPGHFAAELFAAAVGAKIVHVPYKGNAPAVLALVAGEVQAAIVATPGLIPHVKSGKTVALAVTNRQRSAALPEVPTTAEAGLRQFDLETLQVMMVPANTPPAVVDVVRRAVLEALDDAALRARLAQLDMVVERQFGAAAEQRLAQLRSRFGQIVKTTGMKAE